MKTILLLILAIVFLAGCGDSAISPEQLGKQIGATYHAAMHDAALLLKGIPPAADVKDKLLALKTKYVKIMAAYGQIRQKMIPDDKETVDSVTYDAVANYNKDDGDTIRLAMEEYGRLGENEMAVAASHFLIITQYANFDVLLKYHPQEAAQVGAQ
ncbi:MAG: hypothetical protein HPY53_11940 [Brevinematales bacterium]|nr:hypothetical protein [Brevinematales bacterium]